MSTSSYDSVAALGATVLKVGPGATLAAFIKFDRQQGVAFHWLSGGTLIDIVGMPYGTTLTAAQLVSAQNNAFRIDVTGTNPPADIPSSGPFYIMCQGATALISLMARQSQGDGVLAYQN